MEQYTIQLFSDSPYEFFKECVLSKDEIKKYPTIQDIIDLDNGEDNTIIPVRYKNIKILYEVLTTEFLSISYKLENIFNILEAVDFLGNHDHVNLMMDYIKKHFTVSRRFLSIEQKKQIRNGLVNIALSLQYYLLCGLRTIDIEYEVIVSNNVLKCSNNLDYLLLIDHNASAKGCVIYNRGQVQPVDKNSVIYCNIGHLQNTIVDNGDIYTFSAIFNSNASWLEISANNYRFMQYYADNCYRKNRLVRVIDIVKPKITEVSTYCNKFMTVDDNGVDAIWSMADLKLIIIDITMFDFSPSMKTILMNNDNKGTYHITRINDDKSQTIGVVNNQGQYSSSSPTNFIFSYNENLVAEITKTELGCNVRIITNEGHVKSNTILATEPLLLTDNYLVSTNMREDKIYLNIDNISDTKDSSVPCYSQSITAPQGCTFSHVKGHAGPKDTFLMIFTINPINHKLHSQRLVRKYLIRKFVDTFELLQTLE